MDKSTMNILALVNICFGAMGITGVIDLGDMFPSFNGINTDIFYFAMLGSGLFFLIVPALSNTINWINDDPAPRLHYNSMRYSGVALKSKTKRDKQSCPYCGCKILPDHIKCNNCGAPAGKKEES